MSERSHRPPLVILGFDGADVRFMEPWTREGFLPTTASLMERGCWGRLGGREMIREHGLWLSLFSGASAADHGYYHYRQLRPGSYDLAPMNSAGAAAQPFWASLRESGLRVAIVDSEMATVGGLDGFEVAHWAVHQAAIGELPPTGEPPGVLDEVRRIFGPRITLCEYEAGSSYDDDCAMYRRMLDRIARKGVLCRALLARPNFDVIVVGFYESHTGAHRFWPYRPEADPSAPPTALTHAIRDIYQAIDREMGLLLRQLPAEANVVLASVFGMEDQYPIDGLTDAFCRQLGYQAAPPPASGSWRPTALARHALPASWRTAISRRLPRPVQERLLADAFRAGTDWRRTVAFPVPSIYQSFLRVNLRGREPAGTVAAGPEYDDVLDRLDADLRQLVDPLTGRAAVRRIVRTTRWFDCEPHPVLPDLFVDWMPGRRFIDRVEHPRAALTQSPPAYFRGNYHSYGGFLAAAGPSITARGALGDLELLDLAPTFLGLLGRPAPDRRAGRLVEPLAPSLAEA